MRQFINLIENADFDFRHNDAAKLNRFGDRSNSEFTDRGRADIPVRKSDPRFADNPMSDGIPMEEDRLDEFQDTSQIEQIHDLLRNTGVSDQEIRQSSGNLLTHAGLMKVAARIGISPEEVQTYIGTLVQNLRDQRDDEQDAELDEELDEVSLAEQYRRFIAEDGTAARPLADAADDRYSVEDDALGSVTVRDDKTGDAQFYQGSQATNILHRLKQPGANKDAVLAPLVEFQDDVDDADVDALTAPGGSYNFMWKIGGEHGTGTATFNLVDDKPVIRVVDARDQDGNEIDMHAHMDELLRQARAFIPEA